MTKLKGVNVNMPTTPAEDLTTEIGLNHIDLAFVQTLMAQLLPSEQAAIVNGVLRNVALSMNTLQSLAEVTQEGMREALLQRNRALQELENLNYAVEIIDQNNPRIAQLVQTVWDAAQADMLQQIEAQKGA